MKRREKLYIFCNIVLVIIVAKYFLYIDKTWYVATNGLVPSLTITFLTGVALVLNLMNFYYKNCHDKDAGNCDKHAID